MKCVKCGEEMLRCEQACYGTRCEDCYSTVWIYLGKQARSYCMSLDSTETVYGRKVRRRKVKKAQY